MTKKFIVGTATWVCMIWCTCLVAQAQEMTLEYQARFDPEPFWDLHAAIDVGDNRLLMTGVMGMGLVDMDTLTPAGSTQLMQNEFGNMDLSNGRNLYTTGDGYVYVNTHRFLSHMGGGDPGMEAGCIGFLVVKMNGDSFELVQCVFEEDILYEKMDIAGDYLYVTAHRHGLRIFDISDRENPVLTGSLSHGFTNAWAVAVEGDLAYVADAQAGLKIVDVSDKAAPQIVVGETLDTAGGTAQTITVRDNRVYMGLGGKGLAVYLADDLSLASRTIHDIGGFVEELVWINEYLAVTNYGGVQVFRPLSGTAIERVAAEKTPLRNGDVYESHRVAVGVNAAGNKLLVSTWNYLDVYELKPAAEGTQPDINSSLQRVRFHKDGGSETATLSNNGQGVLHVTDIRIDERNPSGAFLVDGIDTPLQLDPGESIDFDISYQNQGGGCFLSTLLPSNEDAGTILIASNDPDESPLPIDVRGESLFYDPGETVEDFTYPTYTYNSDTDDYDWGSFTLSDHRGKVVLLAVYASW
jgi:hypothetical protein